MDKLSSHSLMVIFSCILIIYVSCLYCSGAKHTLGAGEGVDFDSGDLLESSNKQFQLVRVSSSVSILRVYNNDKDQLVWDANGYQQLSNVVVSLIMNQDGRLAAYTSDNDISFIVNAKQDVMIRNSTATLLDNGNLVLTAPGGRTVWQSFDYPCDVWLIGMKLGIFDLNTRSPRQSFLTSVGGADTNGLATFGVDPNNTKQLTIGGVQGWISGVWNGNGFPFFFPVNVSFTYSSNENESYFTWNRSSDPYAFLSFTGSEINLLTSNLNQLSIISCPQDTSQGCTCGLTFEKRNNFIVTWDRIIPDANLTTCGQNCSRNCSCIAYAAVSGSCRLSANSSFYKLNGSQAGEDIYVRTHINWREVQNSSISFPAPFPAPTLPPDRIPTTSAPALSPAPLGPFPRKHSRKWLRFLLGAAAVIMVFFTILSLSLWKQSRNGLLRGTLLVDAIDNIEIASILDLLIDRDVGLIVLSRLRGAQRQELSDQEDDSLFYNFASIELATNQFSDENKLGEGGYGSVYKGKLLNGQEIAVKRLHRMSKYGIEQFKNEVRVISKLQHCNLVRLLGYCSQREERILIYEYMPKNSLDSILFDKTKRVVLDWKLRLRIIEGIAQGILYLHKYSRLKVIHRDLKASNILMDNDLNPKISDFGTAKIFGDDESRANTNRIVGTYGYMSPEYAMDGIFSVKSDVFSFGVLMLEIISGRKNNSFYDSDRHINLLGFVWDLWTGRSVLDIFDPDFVETVLEHEVLRHVQVGLLCVQEKAADRPTMSDVLSMIINESMPLDAPKRPSFAALMSTNDANLTENQKPPPSANRVTITDLEGR